METNNVNSKWLIDVPVAINFFARPDTLKTVFEQIKKAKPSKLFLIADGPREGVSEDRGKCRKCREIVEEIDWDCDVYKFYNKSNKGLFYTYFDAMKKVFAMVDYCIFMEDDVVVSQSFFRYCKELLEKYKDDLRVSFVTAINIVDNGIYDAPDGDYFFSGEGALTAYGLWKRTFESMNLDFCNNSYTVAMMEKEAKKVKPGYEKRIVKYLKEPGWQGHIPHVEVYKNLLRFSQQQICIVPKKNMVKNIGVCSNATHSANDIRKLPKATQRIFNAKIYEYEFPLKSPDYFVCDSDYEKQVNYLLAWNRPVLKYVRRVEAMFRHLRYGDFKRVFNKWGGVFQKGYKE